MLRFEHKGELYAIAFINERIETGTHFYTANDDDIQVGTWKYSDGKKLPAHFHDKNERTITRTQEFVYVKSGELRCFVSSIDSTYKDEFVLRSGDYAVFLLGCHGYEFISDGVVIEVKCGKFNYDDKVRV